MSALHPYVRAALDEIKADPDDDTHRLMLADWLEENATTVSDRDRGTFLRLQVQAAARPAWDSRRLCDRDAAEQLLCRHQDAWLGTIWTIRYEAGRPSRGLLRLRCTPVNRANLEEFLGDETRAAWVEAADLHDPSGGGKILVQGFTPTDLRRLFVHVRQVAIHTRYLDGGWSDALVEADPSRLTLLQLPDCSGEYEASVQRLHCPALRELWADEVATAALCTPDHFPQLRRLYLQGDGNRVLRGGRLPHLRRLHVTQVEAASLRSAHGFPSLRDCRIASPVPTTTDHAALARCPFVPHLDRLTVDGLTPDAPGLADLLAAAGALSALEMSGGTSPLTLAGAHPTLRALTLWGVPLGPDLGPQGGPTLLDGLDAVELNNCRLDPESVRVLGRSAGMSRWRHLSLEENALGEAGVQALLAAGQPLALESLSLTYCALPRGGVRALEPLARLAPNLRTLNLRGNDLCDDDLTWLASWDGLDRIEVLNVDDLGATTSAGTTALLRSPGLRACHSLSLSANTVPVDLVDATRARFGRYCC